MNQKIGYILLLLFLIGPVFFIFLGLYIISRKQHLLEQILTILFKPSVVKTIPIRDRIKDGIWVILAMFALLLALISILFLITKGNDLIKILIEYKHVFK